MEKKSKRRGTRLNKELVDDSDNTQIIICTFLLLIGILFGLSIGSNETYSLDTSNLIYGDLDCDKKVTSADAVTLARAVTGMITLTAEQKVVADLNQDGKVDKKDQYILGRYLVDYDSMTLPYSGQIKEIVYGDIDLDGKVTSSDAVLLKKYLDKKSELTDEQKLNADLNLDGEIDKCDSDLLGRHLTDSISLPYVTTASPSNASPNNASPNNASPSNAANDNILYLNKISFKSDKVIAGEKVYVSLDVSGAHLNYVRLYLSEDTNGERVFDAELKDLATDNPYIVIPNNIPGGTYYIREVILIGLNSNNLTFTKHYSSVKNNSSAYMDLTNNKITVTNNNKGNKVETGKVTLSKSVAKVGEQVKVNIEKQDNLFYMNLSFKSESGNEFKAYLDRFNIQNEGSYFIIPSNVKPDKYFVKEIEVSNGGDITYYNKDNGLDDITLEVKTNKENTYTYNNINFGEEQLKEIYDAPKNATISIDANVNAIINQELFETIKGTDKKLVINYRGNEIIFSGKDIDNPKTIDASITIENDIQNNEEFKKINDSITDGVILLLSSNGTLPGKATYRLVADEETKKILGNNKIYLYFYNEEDNTFSLIGKNVTLYNNYYEIVINHNSKFILTKNKIDSKYVVKTSNNIVDFQNTDNTNKLIICLGIGLILAVIVLIAIISKNNKDNNNE